MDHQHTQNPVEQAQQAAHQETAPRHVRRYRAILFQGYIIAALAGFAILAVLASTAAYFPMDVTITRTLQANNPAWVGVFMSLISWPGFFPQALILTVLLLIATYIFGYHWETVAGLVAAALSFGLNTAVKLVVHRPRPSPNLVHVVQDLGSYSYPSGHVMYYVGFFGFLCFLAYTLLKPSWIRGVLLVVFGGLVIFIGPSRIFLGEHWASDVLGGYLMGSLTLFASVYFYRWGKARFFKDQPVAQDGGIEPGQAGATPPPKTG